MKKIGKYLLNVAIGLDQLLNTLGGGDPDETVSSRIGKMKIGYGGVVPWRRPLLKIIDFSLETIDKNHSINAIEKDEGKDAVRRV